MDLKPVIDVSEYPVGVIVARFQTNKLHEAHRDLIDTVCKNHKQVILFLGVASVQNTERNPLSFAARKIMIQLDYPNIIILPINDNRSNKGWSDQLDASIKIPFGEKKALLYGSRESFIPYYQGKYQTTELVSKLPFSGTEMRKEVSNEVLESEDFRAGMIYSATSQWPVAYPCVDVVAINDNNELLLAKKPGEDKWRFVGGHVDPTDESFESAAKREFSEETNNCEIGDLQYITSTKVNDWRYRRERSGIITTLFMGKFLFGNPKGTDDIVAVEWISDEALSAKGAIDNLIMEEHRGMMEILIKKLNK